MLDQERTPIGKLKQAFELSEQDVETVISALWPHGIFPYALWNMAYKSHWKDAASHNVIYYKAKAPSSLPEFNPLEYQLPLLHIYRDRIVTFFRELSVTIFVTDLMEGLQRMIEWAYEKPDDELNADIEYFFDGLSRIESELNFSIQKPFTWATNITSEIFYEVFKSKVLFIAPCTTSFVSRIFTDTITVDKIATIRFLLRSGYSLRHEVKGISRALVERIAATLDSEPQVEPVAQAPTTHPQENIPAEPSAPTMPTILVSRSLWEGKSPEGVCDGMRKEGFHDAIIAKVLVDWCKINKTQAGITLGPHGNNETDSASRHRIYKLLKKATAYTIIME